MTKRFHVCDEKCEPAGTGIHNTSDAKKVKLPSGTKVKSTKKSADNAFKKQLDRIKKTKDHLNNTKTVSTVYKPDYTVIDETLEDIKKITRVVSKTDYSTNNIYLILQDALKKITLAEN